MSQWRERLSRLLAGPDQGPAVVSAAPLVPLREIFRRFWPYARPYRRWMAVALLFIFLDPAIDTAMIWIFKVMVDEVMVPRDFGRFGWIALVYAGLSLGAGIVSFCQDYFSTWLGQRFLLSMRTTFFSHLQSLSFDFFERRQLGDIVSRITGDIGAIEDLVLSGVNKAIARVLQIVFFTAMLFYLRWELTAVALVVVPFFWLAARYFSQLIKRYSREQRRRAGSISAVAQESLANIVLVQAYNRQEQETERFHQQNLGSFTTRMAATRVKALFGPLVSLLQLSGVLMVVGLGTWELTQDRISLGGLFAFLAYLSRLYSPVRGLSGMANTVASASAGAERIIEFLDQRPSVTEREAPVKLQGASGLITFDGVSFCYPGSDRPAVAGVSFQLEPGGMLALVGQSGAGKSTVAKLLLRFYDPTAGKISLDGHDYRDLDLHALRENVAVLLQDTLVFQGTIRENIAYGRLGATDEEIAQAAEMADAHDFILSLPEGYETVIGQRGQLLSGGQRQRIAIARAMVRNAPLLILDEPTTGLDAESGWRVLKALRRLMQGRTTILISHNLMTVREASRILVLQDGRVEEQGTHDELLDLNGIYARLHRLHHPESGTRIVARLDAVSPQERESEEVA